MVAKSLKNAAKVDTVADTKNDISKNLSRPERTLTWQRKQIFLLFALIAAVYVGIGIGEYIFHAPGIRYYPHFIYLADGWLHGHMYLNALPSALDDYTFYHGHWYVAFPPLPGVLLLPLVAIFHLNHQNLILLFPFIALGIINSGLMFLILVRLVKNYGIDLSPAALSWIVLFFALGTETLYVTMQGSVWFQAHVVATTFLLLHIYETFGKRRPWVAGIFLGLASLSRSTTLLAFPFYILLTIATEDKKPHVLLKQIIIFGLVLGVFGVGMLLYNLARFGSPLDFGYATMNVNVYAASDLHRYGQFSLHFLQTNLYYMWVQPPILVGRFPSLTFTPLGTGIFWTMPALLFAVLAFRRREQRLLALALLAGCVLPLAFLLLYFNTGWVQFGNRFSLDYLPFAFLLAVLGMRFRQGWLEKFLIGSSIAINIWGYIVFAYFPFAIKASFLK
jgi:hypothetical protein